MATAQPCSRSSTTSFGTSSWVDIVRGFKPQVSYHEAQGLEHGLHSVRLMSFVVVHSLADMSCTVANSTFIISLKRLCQFIDFLHRGTSFEFGTRGQLQMLNPTPDHKHLEAQPKSLRLETNTGTNSSCRFEEAAHRTGHGSPCQMLGRLIHAYLTFL